MVIESFRRFVDSDIWSSFKQSKVTLCAAAVSAAIILAAVAAPLISLHNPFDPAVLSLMDAFSPPVWLEEGSWIYILPFSTVAELHC